MKSWKKEFLKEWWEKYPDYLPLGTQFRGLWQRRQVKRIIKELGERQLDIQIAQQVFGYMVNVKELTEYQDYGGQIEYPELMYLAEVYDDGSGEHWKLLPHYSTDIKDAFLIVDKFSKDKFDCNVSLGRHIGDPENAYADFYYGDSNSPWKPGTRSAQGWALTIPLAICSAALNMK